MEAALSPHATTRTAEPVSGAERIPLLDVLRGFALGGVFLANVYVWFSGRVLLPPERAHAIMERRVDAIVDYAFAFFVAGKFFTIFAFLFGVGLAVQFGRAEERKDPVSRRYARRALVMFAIGVVHFVAIWYGDILHTYAIAGFALLLLRSRSPRTLIALCALLTLPFATWASLLPHIWTSPEVLQASEGANAAELAEFNAQRLTELASGSYGAVVHANVLMHWNHWFQISTVDYYAGLVGRFLLGFCAGRLGMFRDVAGHRRLFRHVMGWGLSAGVLAGGAMLAERLLAESGRIQPHSLLSQVLLPLAWNVATMGMAAFYVASMSLLFQRERWRRILLVLAPVGQMAVTNYLSQSVLAGLLFSGIGLGLIGNPTVLSTVAMPMAVFTAQIWWSHLWLGRYRSGPVEWIWRSLTYGSAQPMRGAGKSRTPSVA